MGFTLGITNAPAEVVLWNANFAEKSFDYDPIADSGWLEVDEVWEYPSDPLGCITLRILALDAENNIVFDVGNLGPINDGEEYIFDCSTGVLPITQDWMGIIAPILILGLMAGLLLPMMKKGFK